MTHQSEELHYFLVPEDLEAIRREFRFGRRDLGGVAVVDRTQNTITDSHVCFAAQPNRDPSAAWEIVEALDPYGFVTERGR